MSLAAGNDGDKHPNTLGLFCRVLQAWVKHPTRSQVASHTTPLVGVHRVGGSLTMTRKPPSEGLQERAHNTVKQLTRWNLKQT